MLKILMTELKTTEKVHKSNSRLKWTFCPSVLKFPMYLMKVFLGNSETTMKRYLARPSI